MTPAETAADQAVRLRAFDFADLSKLGDLWVESWTSVMPQIDFSARRAWFESHIAALHAQGCTIICAETAEGQLLGFVTIDAASHYLDQIAVLPQAFGSTAAKLLIGEAKRYATSHLLLHVNQDNPRALRFYEKQGFVRVEEGVNPRSGLKVWKMRWDQA